MTHPSGPAGPGPGGDSGTSPKTNLATFEFPATGQAIRAVVLDGESLIVAKDICDVLEIGNVSQACRSLDDDEYRTVAAALISTEGRPQDLINVVTEAGLYSLILRSRKPEAKAFKRWVTHDVLPAIRKTGRYESAPAVPQSFAEALELAARQAREIEAQAAALAIAEPKAEAFDAFQSADGTYSFEQVAKMLHAQTGLGRNNLMRRLRELRVLESNNLPYQQYAHHFHVVAQTFEGSDGRRHTTYTTRVAASGVEFIRRRLTGQLAIGAVR